MSTNEQKIIAKGVRNLQEFGYPDVTPENILTDEIYSTFFKSMLEENLGGPFDKEITLILGRMSK